MNFVLAVGNVFVEFVARVECSVTVSTDGSSNQDRRDMK